MIELRRPETDADLEAWIGVRRAILPNESGGTVELLRAQESEERLMLLAEVDGELAGSGLADRSNLPDRFGLKPRVLPAFRRRGVGTALMRALARGPSGTLMQSMPCALQSAAPAISFEASMPRGGRISTKATNVPDASFAPS